MTLQAGWSMKTFPSVCLHVGAASGYGFFPLSFLLFSSLLPLLFLSFIPPPFPLHSSSPTFFPPLPPSSSFHVAQALALNMLCIQRWPRTPFLPASTSQVLGLQLCTTMLNSRGPETWTQGLMYPRKTITLSTKPSHSLQAMFSHNVTAAIFSNDMAGVKNSGISFGFYHKPALWHHFHVTWGLFVRWSACLMGFLGRPKEQREMKLLWRVKNVFPSG